MKFAPVRLCIVALFVGWLFNFLFWNQDLGLNFAVIWAACIMAAFYLLLSEGIRPRWTSLLLLPLFASFAIASFLRADPLTRVLAINFTLLTLVIFAATYLGGRWPQYTFADYIVRSLHLTASVVSRPAMFALAARRAGSMAMGEALTRRLWPLMRGLIIALPVVAIFASLLGSADAVFSQRLSEMAALFGLENLGEYALRAIFILTAGYAFAGVVLHAAFESKDENLVCDQIPLIAPFLGFIEAVVVMASVVLLFAFFAIIQFQYFFGGSDNIVVAGYTYAEYARRGFGELVAAAFLALLLLLALSGVSKRDTEMQKRIFSAFSIALVALLSVLLISAYQRLVLYEAAYGFTRSRTYTHVFLVWIGLLLVATVVLEVLRRRRVFPLAALIASFGFSISLAVLNVDAFIVRQNLQREMSGQAKANLDASYFVRLSDDAIPVLTGALRARNLPDRLHQKLAAALACKRRFRGVVGCELSWQSFHLARSRADRALASVREELDRYQIERLEGRTMAIAPSGEQFPCR